MLDKPLTKVIFIIYMLYIIIGCIIIFSTNNNTQYYDNEYVLGEDGIKMLLKKGSYIAKGVSNVMEKLRSFFNLILLGKLLMFSPLLFQSKGKKWVNILVLFLIFLVIDVVAFITIRTIM